jgi:sugar transferase (PEP-CTERM/EpsH1 system associated)
MGLYTPSVREPDKTVVTKAALEILFLPHRIPFPPTKGDKIRSYHLLQSLSSVATVHLGTFIDNADERKYIPELQRLCGETYFAERTPMPPLYRTFKTLLDQKPLTFAAYFDRRLANWITRLINARPISSVFVFSSAMAQYANALPSQVRRLIVDLVDVDSQKWAAYAEKTGWPLSTIYSREARSLALEEARIAHNCDFVLVVSADEAKTLQRLSSNSLNNVVVIQNGVDHYYFDPQRTYKNPFPHSTSAIVFTGAMDYRPNVEAVTWFANNVFPRVRQKLASAEFYVVGTRPTRKVMRLERITGIEVTGTVPDVRPYLAHCRCAVAPLRMAHGVQNKVLEAMAMQRKVVATPIALKGLPRQVAALASSAEGAAEFAEKVIQTFDARNGGLDRARETILRHHSWDSTLRPISRLISPS